MTNEQILEKAIEKAWKNGFNQDKFWEDWNTTGGDSYQPQNYEFMVIFSHDFAKAFWGDDIGYDMGDGLGREKCWEVNLQIMVLEKEPINYLEKFLCKKKI